MKKWQKWSLGIVGVLLMAILIFVALFWSMLRILMGTEELSGKKETIPKAVSLELKPLIKGNADSLLLCLIGQQPMYGYQIIRELEKRSQGYFKFREGTLYPALHRLEKAGLILGKWQTLPSGRQRRYYYITDKGQRLLVVKMSQWQDFLTAMNLIIRPMNA